MTARTTRTGSRQVVWLVAAVAIVVVALASGRGWERANAITNDDDVQFVVTQSPAAPAIVQPGSTVTYTVAASYLAGSYSSIFFEFAYPAGMSFVTGGSSPPGVICTDNTPAAGAVRCNYNSPPIGTLVPLTLTFAINANSTTAAVNMRVRGGVSDGQPDDATAGTGDAFNGAGTLTVFSPANIAVSDTIGADPVFEGGTTTYSATLTNTTGTDTGTFGASIAFANATVTAFTCGVAGPSAAGTAAHVNNSGSCAGAHLAPGDTLTMAATLIASNSASASAIVPDVTAPAIGITSGAFAEQQFTVNEIGLAVTTGAAVSGSPVNVCTAASGSDVAGASAAGLAQPGVAALVGYPSGSVLLQTGDFSVGGPGVGAVTAATGCAANQSGVRFTPSLGGSYTVTANYNVGGGNTVTIPVTSSAPVAAKLAFTTQPSGGAVGTAWATQPVVTVQDSGGATVTADSSTVTLSGSGLTCTGGLSKAAVNGVATFAGCAMSGAGTFALHASDGALTAADSTSFSITAPSAAKLNFVSAPTSAISGITFGTAPQVEVTDAGGNRMTSDTRQISLTGLGGPGSLTCTNTTVNAVAGLATFNGCQVSVDGSGYYLRATSNPALTQADSAQFSVGAYGGAAKLGFVTQPSGSPAGVAFATQPAVAVQDANGLTVGNNNGTSVTLQVLSGPGTLTCTGGLTKATTSGVATFAGCNASASGSYTLRATSTPAYTQADSSSFTVAVGATKVAFTTQPGNGVSGSALATQPVVAIQDSASATVTSDSTTLITLSLGNANGATLTCTGGLTKTAASGVATFAGCAVSGAGTGYTLQASATNLTSATSNAFNVTQGAATASSQLVVVTPAAGVLTPRSRLIFSATTGTLAPTPAALTFVVKRKSDGKYWNDPGAAWQADPFENVGTLANGTWTFAVTGANRRQFVNMTAVVTAHTTVGGTLYESAAKPEIVIR